MFIYHDQQNFDLDHQHMWVNAYNKWESNNQVDSRLDICNFSYFFEISAYRRVDSFAGIYRDDANKTKEREVLLQVEQEFEVYFFDGVDQWNNSAGFLVLHWRVILHIDDFVGRSVDRGDWFWDWI